MGCATSTVSACSLPQRTTSAAAAKFGGGRFRDDGGTTPSCWAEPSKVDVVEQPASVLQQARTLLEEPPSIKIERIASSGKGGGFGNGFGNGAAIGGGGGGGVQQPNVAVEQRLAVQGGTRLDLRPEASLRVGGGDGGGEEADPPRQAVGSRSVELKLSRASLLTEVELVLGPAARLSTRRRPTFELFVNDSASASRCVLIPSEGSGGGSCAGRLQPPSAGRPRGSAAAAAAIAGKAQQAQRCRLQLVEPVDDARTIVLAVSPPSSSSSSAAPEPSLVELVREVVPFGLPAGSDPPRRRLLRPPPYWQTAAEEAEGGEGASRSRRLEVEAEEAIATFQRLLDETWKPKATRDRKGALPKRLLVRKVQRVEAPVLWNQYSHCRRRLGLRRSGRGGGGSGGCTPIEALDRDSSDAADSGPRPGGLAPAPRPVRTRALCQAAPDFFGPCDEKSQEHYLFHGTSPDGALGIVREGFDLGRAGDGKHLLFGPGAYFAECSSKFDEYARPDKFSGLCAVLVCRVACGELLRTERRLEQAPAHPDGGDGDEDERHDGVLGDREASVGTYREFVVWSQDQVYPEYVVFYDRQY